MPKPKAETDQDHIQRGGLSEFPLRTDRGTYNLDLAFTPLFV